MEQRDLRRWRAAQDCEIWKAKVWIPSPVFTAIKRHVDRWFMIMPVDAILAILFYYSSLDNNTRTSCSPMFCLMLYLSGERGIDWYSGNGSYSQMNLEQCLAVNDTLP